jgi:hypothetical protein
MAESDIAEVLARLEHKVDNLTRIVTGERLVDLPQLGEPVMCPTCKQQVKYYPDPLKKMVVRQCGCKTGIQPALDLTQFAPPVAPARKGEPDGTDQEDGSDSYHRRGPRRR